MKTDLFTINELKREKMIRERNHDYSFSGKTGHCFVKGDKVIKLYDNPKKYNRENDLTKYNSNYISFPIDYLYERGNIIGEVLPYFKADVLDQSLNLRSNVNSFIDSYNVLKEEVNKFPYIAMSDIWKRNILYSNKKGMFLIDTTDWVISNNQCNSYNIKQLESSILIVLKDLILDNEKESEDLLRFFYDYICEGKSIISLLSGYIEMIRKNYQYNIKNLSDVKKYMKIMKKS